MNSTISRSNLESLLTEGWLASLIDIPEGDWEIKLDIPDTIKFEVINKEVHH